MISIKGYIFNYITLDFLYPIYHPCNWGVASNPGTSWYICKAWLLGGFQMFQLVSSIICISINVHPIWDSEHNWFSYVQHLVQELRPGISQNPVPAVIINVSHRWVFTPSLVSYLSTRAHVSLCLQRCVFAVRVTLHCAECTLCTVCCGMSPDLSHGEHRETGRKKMVLQWLRCVLQKCQWIGSSEDLQETLFLYSKRDLLAIRQRKNTQWFSRGHGFDGNTFLNKFGLRRSPLGWVKKWCNSLTSSMDSSKYRHMQNQCTQYPDYEFSKHYQLGFIKIFKRVSKVDQRADQSVDFCLPPTSPMASAMSYLPESLSPRCFLWHVCCLKIRWLLNITNYSQQPPTSHGIDHVVHMLRMLRRYLTEICSESPRVAGGFDMLKISMPFSALELLKVPKIWLFRNWDFEATQHRKLRKPRFGFTSQVNYCEILWTRSAALVQCR